MTDSRCCLTCGGPAWLCATSRRCVGLEVTRPHAAPPGLPAAPPLADRTSPWPRVAVTFAVWLCWAYLWRSFAPSGRPLQVFVMVPLAAAAAAVTYATWRPRL